jgi:Prokaryotic N-terminal methylation motif
MTAETEAPRTRSHRGFRNGGRKGVRHGDAHGFTLFEVLIALGVFMLAVTGLVIAIDTSLQVLLETRRHAASREMLESRLAYCQADPPAEGTPRVIDARENRGIRVEESLLPFPAKDAKDQEITGLKKLRIITSGNGSTNSAEILIYQP